LIAVSESLIQPSVDINPGTASVAAHLPGYKEVERSVRLTLRLQDNCPVPEVRITRLHGKGKKCAAYPDAPYLIASFEGGLDIVVKLVVDPDTCV
jgi:hypothetical protein